MFDNIQTEFNIYDALNRLNIKYKGKPNHKSWLSILCPTHNDKHYGSCSININTGIINCWVCGSNHINNLLDSKTNLNFTYTEERKSEEVKKVNPKLSEQMKYNFVNMKINPDDYYYTRTRGFTQEFIDYFNIVRCFSFPYKDYMAISIIDTSKDIRECEFRKLMVHEYKQLLPTYETEIYLNDKKVKYEINSRLKQTIFNIDNLNRNDILYLCEGVGSIPKIWHNISKNVSCTFGSQIIDPQLIYLKQFKQIIIIPDPDEAGFNCVNKLRESIPNLQVIDIESEDTDEQYIFDIQNTNILTASEYIGKNLIKYNIKSLF